jgi:hypothetical protein
MCTFPNGGSEIHSSSEAPRRSLRRHQRFIDAWTNNLAYVGHRATGTDAAGFLLVPAGWDGTPEPGETVIHLPTHVATIIGRWRGSEASRQPSL